MDEDYSAGPRELQVRIINTAAISPLIEFLPAQLEPASRGDRGSSPPESSHVFLQENRPRVGPDGLVSYGVFRALGAYISSMSGFARYPATL